MNVGKDHQEISLSNLNDYQQKEETKEQLEERLLQREEEQQIQTTEQYSQDQERFINVAKRFLFGPKVQTVSRIISLNGTVNPPNYFKNIVKNQKYSIISFVFVVLFNEFKYFFNMFFLLIAISQFIPPLQVGLQFTYIAPLVLVLTLTMLKEAYDDFKRFQRDREANSQIYQVLKVDQPEFPTKSCDLKVGDIIQVQTNQRIPADLLLLYTSDPSGDVFIKTDQLDGETDWKLRKPVRLVQSFAKEQGPEQIIRLNAQCQAQEPIENIYKFTGVFEINHNQPNIQKESLSLENTMWANTVLASGKIWALVLYTGKETRMAMNSRDARSKFGQLDTELNYLSKLLFVFMVISSIVLVVLQGVKLEWYTLILTFRYLLLLSSIIPISMRVNLEFAKLIYCYKINIDQQMPGTVARSSQIPEELGRIQFILTDKTGTLTQNDMTFKKLSLESGIFTYEETSQLQEIVKVQCSLSYGPMADIEKIVKKKNLNDLEINSTKEREIKNIRREKDVIIRDLITALAICHNVTPIEGDDGSKSFQASSPDEVALVKIAEDMGITLESRSQEQLVLKNANNQIETYNILANFPFSSHSKRMGILVKHVETGRYIFYLKGADTVICEKIPKYQKGFLKDECDSLAREGLRTLVITQKYLTEEQFNSWNVKYQEARTSLENRDEKEEQVIHLLEKDMEFLGITGVEDKLQEDVCNTLESLRNAGIKIWMLTGDKVETATCIAISAGIMSNPQRQFLITECENSFNLQQQLQRFNNESNYVLIIDGISLKLALEKHENLFFEVSTKAPAVVCCRCSPTQKAQITECIKKYTGKKTAGVGDGGNDVGMIQSADVGIGIVGKEGMQAALAADFSIEKFKYLNRLLLWHGRLSYKRSSVLSQFVIHRGLIISVIQMIFIVCFYFVPIPVYDGLLMLGYSTIFTMFPVFSLVFDEDIDEKTSMDYPPLYQTLQKGRELNTKTFFGWIWVSIYQGTIIMVISFMLFKDAFINIQTITYAALIISEILNILTSIHKIHIVMIISIVCSMGIYILTIYILRNTIMTADLDFGFFWRLCCVIAASWLPPFIFKLIMKKIDPSDYEKVMLYKKTDRINYRIR
ncbi:phospholipid-translocating P-type ATPase, flippase family protein (macronuclear) [Tetrahymena thermophila SB210]|uniref:Phospholipid-transporting ATPase n=1 Tax=Tetrahymena thermophila (strain SB210) TaxID=312017 RepID=A4VD01_TETTS|nr:phospholipid-translocating P-type ATPase, flippase family protein [Tetrahymena thermophila SB210]EDK31407.1 phospholipid-translocating P-type ATPase, flippase family protein [Tetrahymena thermophila SB210]|eukprot:XP_001471002.1 phospholipid-translocating P-type ATPase, flippase family protein [Tetrahymena thermophila SB210]